MTKQDMMKNLLEHHKWSRLTLIAALLLITISLLLLSNWNYEREPIIGVKRSPLRLIFDSGGSPLAINQECYEIYADPQILKDGNAQKRIAELAGEYLGSDKDRVLARMQTEYVQVNPDNIPVLSRYSLIAKYVETEEALKFKEVLRKLDLLNGICFREISKRYYPNGSLLSNVIGLVTLDDDHRGLFGIEGWIYKEAQKGNFIDSVSLTVNLPMQEIVEREADILVKKWSPRELYAILVNPRNGNILAIAQRPCFDPNERSHMDLGVTRNFPLEKVFKPGPMLIPLVVSEALDRGIVKAEEKISCGEGNGGSVKDPGTGATFTPLEIIVNNSCSGAGKIGLRMGARKLYDSLCRLGVGQSCGLYLSPENVFHLRDPDKWDESSVEASARGYGLKISTAQLARAYCVLADNGNLRKLRLIDSIKSYGDETIVTFPISPMAKALDNPESIKNVLSTFTQKVASSGRTYSMKNFMVPQYDEYISKWIAAGVGLAPAEKPEFVMLIIMEISFEVKENMPTAAALDNIMAQLLEPSTGK